MTPTSRFTPTVEQMRETVAKTQDLALRLAARIVAARHALQHGAPTESVLAILDGKGEQ